MKLLFSALCITSLLVASDQTSPQKTNISRLADAIHSLENNCNNLDLFIITGIAAYKAGNYSEAERFFSMSAVTNSAIGAQLKACCLYDQGNTQAAITWEKRAGNWRIMR